MKPVAQSLVRTLTKRLAVGILSLSAGGFAAWQVNEGFSPSPYIPTKGDRPTIGYGNTFYEDGTPVRLTDPPIDLRRAEILARSILGEKELCLKRSLPPGLPLHQEEYDLYVDFIGQYGCGNWSSSTARNRLASGNYPGACQALLMWRLQNGRDCSLPENWGPQGCKGVWTRQQKRYAKCMSVQ